MCALYFYRYYDDGLQQQRYIHFISKPALDLRLLEHFYTFLHFQDPWVRYELAANVTVFLNCAFPSRKMDLYYKRFVRDYLHYTDVILCKSAAIVDRLLREGGGSYISFHIRRGDFQVSEYNEANYSFLFEHHIRPTLPLLVQRDEAVCWSDSREYRPLHVSEQWSLLIS